MSRRPIDRFWWRDTRLAEITQSTLSMTGYQATVPLPMVSVPPTTTPSSKYQFPYPTTFLPVPYYADTSLSYIYEQIIPSTRIMRSVVINVPVFYWNLLQDAGGMDVDAALSSGRNLAQVPMPTQQTFSFSFAHNHAQSSASQPPPPPPTGKPATAVASVQVNTFIEPDGLLLYVAESGYEPGTSPLSSWIPIVGYEKEEEQVEVGTRNKGEVKRERENGVDGPLKRAGGESPLDLFERWVSICYDLKHVVDSQCRLVKKRLEKEFLGNKDMDMDL